MVELLVAVLMPGGSFYASPSLTIKNSASAQQSTFMSFVRIFRTNSYYFPHTALSNWFL
jgi:hypothetical protein